MIVLGVVLIVVVAVLTVAVVVSNPEVVDLNLFNALVPVTMGGVFFTGAVSLLLVLIAGLLIQRGIARTAKLRRQLQARAGAPATPPPAPAPSAAAPTTTSPPATTTEPDRPRAAGAHAVDRAPSAPRPVSPHVTPPSAPVTTVTTDAGAAVTGTAPTSGSSLDLDGPEPKQNATERAALLAEADELTRDEPLR